MTELIDLASRAVGGGVVAASDETFAEKENLVTAAAPTHAAHTFGHKGQVYDGWETRRRRDDLGPDGDDWAVVRLGLPGIVHRVVVDTAFFAGNHPVSADVDTCWIEGHPAPDEVVAGPWERLCGAELQGDTAHTVEAEVPRAATHVRLRIHPDGGVARLRVLGVVLPDVRRWRGIGVDLASLAAGGRVLDASNRHYSPPENLLLPRSATTMGEGWETRRHRRARRRPSLAAWRVQARIVGRALELGIGQGWDMHPAMVPARLVVVTAVHRAGLPAAVARLRAYRDGASAGVLDEPATEWALVGFLRRGVACGAVDPDEVGDLLDG